MKYISLKLGKYAGSNNEEFQLLDAYSDVISDWVAKWVSALFSGDEALLKSYKKEYLPQQLELWNTILSDSISPYILGDEISYADFALYHILGDNDDLKSNDVKYPNIEVFLDAVRARPNISKYFAAGRH